MTLRTPEKQAQLYGIARRLKRKAPGAIDRHQDRSKCAMRANKAAKTGSYGNMNLTHNRQHLREIKDEFLVG